MSNYKSYFLKSLGLREDQLPGGKGDESQPNQVDQEQLQMGIKVEMEHTHDQDLAKEIAMDHLSEDPQYYSHLKSAGMADELPNGQQPAQTPMMSKLMSPTARNVTPVIGVAVRGTKSGLLPAGGYVEDPEKARLGGWEPVKVLPQGGAIGDKEKARLGGLEAVKNPKANSQGAFANTPSSDALKADGGHYTPDNKDISQGKAPETNRKGCDSQHPMQVQQIGNPPPKDDGTGRNGEGLKPTEPKGTEEHPMSSMVASKDGEKDDGRQDLTKAGIDDGPEGEEKESPKGPWGIELGDDEDEEEEGEDVSIDIKETLQEALGPKAVKAIKEAPVKECSTCGCGNPADDHGMKNRFQQLANIPKTEAGAISEDGERSDYEIASTETSPTDYVKCPKCGKENYLCHCDNESPSMRKWAQDAVKRKQLEELVGRLNAKGKVTPLLQKAQAYLVKSKSK